MKKIALALALFIGLSSFAQAQENNTPKGKRTHNKNSDKGGRHNRNFDNLTDEQKKKMEKIDADFAKEKKAIDDSKLTREEQKAKKSELRDKKRDAIKSILTDEQKKQWEDKWASKRNDSKRMKDGNRSMKKRNFSKNSEHPTNKDSKLIGGHKGTWVMAGIDLSDKQKEEYKKIAENYKKDIESLQGKHKGEREGIDKKQMESVKKILTDDQKKVFEENLKNKKEHKSSHRR